MFLDKRQAFRDVGRGLSIAGSNPGAGRYEAYRDQIDPHEAAIGNTSGRKGSAASA